MRFCRLTRRLVTLVPDKADAIVQARSETLKTYFDEYVDAGDLLRKFIANDVAVEESRAAVSTLAEWIGDPFLTGPDRKRLSGTSIFYPKHWTDGMDSIEKYKRLAFDERLDGRRFWRRPYRALRPPIDQAVGPTGASSRHPSPPHSRRAAEPDSMTPLPRHVVVPERRPHPRRLAAVPAAAADHPALALAGPVGLPLRPACTARTSRSSLPHVADDVLHAVA